MGSSNVYKLGLRSPVALLPHKTNFEISFTIKRVCTLYSRVITLIKYMDLLVQKHPQKKAKAVKSFVR
jgi:hypothetical protein